MTLGVSVVIPARDAAATLPEALASLQAQAHTRWEAIVVENGSADDTLAVAEAAAARDGRIRVLSTDAAGVSAARNAGIEAAREDHLLFLDADDWLGPEALARLTARLQADPAVDAAWCGWERVTPSGRRLPEGGGHPEPDLFPALARVCVLAMHCCVVRRDLVVAAHGFDPALRTCEDWDLWQRIARAGARFGLVDGRLVGYRTAPGTASADGVRLMEDALTVLARTHGDGGRPSRELPSAALEFAAYAAGVALAAGDDPAAVLTRLDGLPPAPASPTIVAQHLLAGTLGATVEREHLLAVLEGLAACSLTSLLDRRALLVLDREAGGPTVQRGHGLADVAVEAGAERVVVAVDGIGEVELPAAGAVVPREAVAGALADAHGWAVLRADDPDLDWDGFLRAVTGIDAGHYDPGAHPRRAPRAPVEGGVQVVDLARLPLTPDPARPIRVTCAGATLAVLDPGPRTPGELVAAVVTATGLEAVTAVARARLGAPPTPGPDAPLRHDAPPEPRTSVRQEFEALFASGADPWRYTSPYEQRKYEQTLELLGDVGGARALELACAEGHFTVQLRPRVRSLVAADISALATERAAARCRAAGIDDVEFRRLDLAADALPGGFDLVVCSEVLYYVDDLPAVARRLRDAVAPGGALVQAHAHVLADDPSAPGHDWAVAFGGKRIGEVLASTPGLRLEEELVTGPYRIQRLRRTEGLRRALPARPRRRTAEAVEPTADFRPRGGAPRRPHAEPHDAVPVLMYHRVTPDPVPEAGARFAITPTALAEQLAYLADAGYRSLGSDEWRAHLRERRPFGGRRVVLTFDDGFADFAEHAWPVIRDSGFQPWVFIVSDLAGTRSGWDDRGGFAAPLMDWGTIRELEAAGVRFGGHTATHQPLTGLPVERAADELARCRARLQAELARPLPVLAYPYGDADGGVRWLTREAGWELALTTDAALARVDAPRLALPRIEVADATTLDRFIARLTDPAATPAA